MNVVHSFQINHRAASNLYACNEPDIQANWFIVPPQLQPPEAGPEDKAGPEAAAGAGFWPGPGQEQKDVHGSPKQSDKKIKNDNNIWTEIAAYMFNSSSLGAGIEGDSLTKALVVTSTWSSRRASNH